jgi:hypothetical protein
VLDATGPVNRISSAQKYLFCAHGDAKMSWDDRIDFVRRLVMHRKVSAGRIDIAASAVAQALQYAPQA